MPKPIIDLRPKRVPNGNDRDGSHDIANKGGLVMQVVGDHDRSMAQSTSLSEQLTCLREKLNDASLENQRTDDC